MSEALEVPLPTRRTTTRLAARLGPYLAAGDLLILSGELGAGKTFFVRALARVLGLPARVRVTSPTFSLVHELATEPPIVHADLYRLEREREVQELGLDEYREAGSLLLVEWGEKWIAALGGDAVLVDIRVEPRCAWLSATGGRSREIVAALRAELDRAPVPSRT